MKLGKIFFKRQNLTQRHFKAYVTSSMPMLRRTFWRMSFRPCSDKIKRLLLNEAQTDNNSDTFGRDIPNNIKYLHSILKAQNQTTISNTFQITQRVMLPNYLIKNRFFDSRAIELLNKSIKKQLLV